jgi:ABC-type lipoprotein export system ATPase subunit
VWVDGKDLLKMSYAAINHYRQSKVGFVWQQGSRNLIPYLTALENVRLPITVSGREWSKERQRAEALLEAVGLSERKYHRLSEMSRGEQQRVAIAVALANNPMLLLADEPTGEVDSATAAGIFQVLQELNRQFGLTTIIVSHDMGIARQVDRVVAIRDGKTSSETVRQSATSVSSKTEATTTGENVEEIFEEVILLDSAGRLQVPRDYLERLNIQGRVRLELTEEGILIRPAQVLRKEQETSLQTREQVPAAESHGLRGWWKRIRSEGKSRGRYE